ncbi:MAG: aspartyl/asparaginyl beta-hydroxylase domain-containing protein [Pseudomonadota bacterium]
MNDTSTGQARQNALCGQALDAELAGQLEGAVVDYVQAVKIDQANPVPLLFLGYALAAQGLEERAAAAWSLAADRDPRVVNAWRGQVREDIAVRSKAAHKGVRQWFTRLHERALQAFAAAHPEAAVARIEEAVWVQTHDGEVSFRAPAQKPHVFYVPALASTAVFSREQAPWLSRLEGAFDAICEEYVAACELVTGQVRPYLDWKVARSNPLAHLAQSRAWAALHLFKQSEPNQRVIAHFPRTLAALRELPLLEVDGQPREVLFSVLAPGQHITPHYGLANTDATVHLPLIVPGDSALRVADVIYPWERGKALAFDDSFIHDSWNNADSERVTLLFEAWHPDLTEQEQRAVQACFEARAAWNLRRPQLALS